jgi:hypothetical protein
VAGGGGRTDKTLTEEEKKEKKREYMRNWFAKNKNKKKEKGTTRPTLEDSGEGKNALVHATKNYVEGSGIPIDLVNEYGLTAVEVVLAEKNRGIGYTADEIHSMADKRLKIFSLAEIEDMHDRLVAAGL